MLTRRVFLKGLGLIALIGSLSGGYAVAIEPLRLRVQRYRVALPNWPKGSALRLAMLSDIHACHPWMSPARIRRIARRANALNPDITVLLGDYGAGHHWVTGPVHSKDWAPALGELQAPLGVWAVLGNHDWWDDLTAQRTRQGPTFGQRALESAGIRVLENNAVRLDHAGEAFWLAGLGDQIAFPPYARLGRSHWQGRDDLPGTLETIEDDAPVILLAHEPDIFPNVPKRVALTLSGHTHGGQVRILGHAPAVPSAYGDRYAYGHVIEDGRHLIVSGGLGCSVLPIRFGMPPEIVVIDITRAE